MSQIAFIGLGNMGGPMAANLARSGRAVRAYDLIPAVREIAAEAGCAIAGSVADAVAGAEAVITMLPAGPEVRRVYEDPDGVLTHAPRSALLVDCSTIDVESARAVADAASRAGFAMLDAPVSGGVAGAKAATLTFMVGGAPADFARAEPLLLTMGKAAIRVGGAGAGQAAKICNNMLLGISMIGTCEAFNLAMKLGLSAQAFFDVASRSSGQCWSVTSYCPVPGPLPASPANRGYAPGFAAALMLKDLKLAQAAARSVGASTPLGAHAEALYAELAAEGGAQRDFSAIIEMIAAREG